MTTVSEDIDTLASEAGPITLESGDEVNVERLRTRQLFKLLKILTRGAAPILGEISWSAETSPELFSQQLLGALVVSIPEAEEEAMEFIRAMVTPIGLIERPRTEAERAENYAKQDALSWVLNNPSLDDTVSILERVIQVEAPEILALGKRLGLLLRTQQTATTAKAGSEKRRTSSARNLNR